MSAALSRNYGDEGLEAVGLTHPGRRRNNNEDAFAVHPDLGFLMVADGMGGHAAGEVASQMTVDTVSGMLLDRTQGWWPTSAQPPRAAGAALVNAIQEANSVVYAAGQMSETLAGMGTTVVAALTFRGVLAVAHVGDSRAYLLRERWLARLTEDHTVANAHRSNDIDPFSLARYAGYWHALTRSVGGGPTIDVETRYLTPRRGDVLLLCSDGLTNVLTDKEIAAILTANRDLQAAADQLVTRVNEGGGPDNVTVALQRWT